MFNNFRFKVLFWFLSLLKLTVYNLPTHYVFFMYLSRFYRLCFKKFIMPGRNHFKDKWLDCTDNNGDKVGLYLHQNGEFGAKCFWCVREFDISSSGFIAITRHADTKRHKSILLRHCLNFHASCSNSIKTTVSTTSVTLMSSSNWFDFFPSYLHLC